MTRVFWVSSDTVLECEQYRRMFASNADAIVNANTRSDGIVELHLLCLGLGSPSDSRDSRAQLCFLSRLSAAITASYSSSESSPPISSFSGSPSSSRISLSLSAYDPVFTPADVELLNDLGIHTLSANEDVRTNLLLPSLCVPCSFHFLLLDLSYGCPVLSYAINP